MADIDSIITAIGSAGATSVILIYLFKTWISERMKGAIKDEYDQKLESHKAQLKAASDVEIEKLISQLQISAAERSIKLTQVFEEQARTIAETYSKLVVFIGAVENYTALFEPAGISSKDERRRIVGIKQAEFLNYYNPRKIYFPQETQSQIDAFALELSQKTLKLEVDPYF